jgi:predicted branched-subunit amino acid permease
MGDRAVAATWQDGVRAVSPLILGVAPFGIIFGVTAIAADVPTIAAWASSFIVFAGASQIAIVELMNGNGTPIVAFITAVVINARHLMYSADMGRYTTGTPLRKKIAMGYLMTDQAYLVTAHRFPDPRDTPGFIGFYFGGALALWTTWQVTTTTGMILGAAIPESWSLEFAIPLTFMALLVLAVKDRPQLIAAATGGLVAVATIGLPYNLGLICGAIAGVLAGLAAEGTIA